MPIYRVQELLQVTKELHKKFSWQEAKKLHEKIKELQGKRIDDAMYWAAIWMKIAGFYETIKQFEEAKAIYVKILQKEENNIAALNNVAALSAQLGQNENAKHYLELLLSLQPDSHYALNNYGNICLAEGKPGMALTFFEKALLHHSDFSIALLNKSSALRALHRTEEAILQYTITIENVKKGVTTLGIVENDGFILAKAIIGKALCLICEARFSEFAICRVECLPLIADMLAGILPPIVDPFESMLLQLPNMLHFAVSKFYGNYYQQQVIAHPSNVSNLVPLLHNNKTKIAYFSADFSAHPVGFLLQDLFALHDKTHFEIYIFSLKSHSDAINAKIKANVDYYFECEHLNDKELADFIKGFSIDLLIDLGGHTSLARPRVLCYKPAKKQAHWLGYSATTGLDVIDYYITHKAHVPPSMQHLFTEKIMYLPRSYIAYKAFAIPKVTRKECNLPEDKFIFCCFNLSYRIDEAVFACWLEILKQVPNSILWLQTYSSSRDERLQTLAVQAKIDASRLHFAPKEALSLRYKHQVADLWLDTFTLTAGTASMLCIQAGLPMVTLAGDTPQSRMSAAYWDSINVSELVVYNKEDYIKKSVDLALSEAQLQRVRNKLLTNIETSVMSSPKDFMKDLEGVYKDIIAS